MAPKVPHDIRSSQSAHRRRLAKFAGLQFERLEDRIAPALFNLSTVTTSNLSNNGCVAVGDFNKDGNPDAVVSNYGPSVDSLLGNRIHVLTGNGSGGFSASSILTQGTNVSFVAVGALDNDGWDDVVASNANHQNAGTVSVFRNNNGVLEFFGTFNTQGNNSSSVALGDVTGDGKLDLVVSNFGKQTGAAGSETITGNTVDVYQGNGNFTFNLLTSITFPQGEGNPVFIPIAATFAKVDSGNTLDLIVISPGATSEGSAAGLVYVFKGNGVGGFDTAAFGQFDSGGFFPVGMAVKDVDGDNDVDIVVTNVGDPTGSPEFVNQGIGVLKNNGNGAFSTTSIPANIHGPFAPAIADFDMDGDQDIAVINHGMYLDITAPATFVSLYLNNGSGTFAPAGPPNTPDGKFGLGFPGGGGQYLAVGDFDKSGAPDIIAVGTFNSIKVLLNTSTASVSTTTALASTANPSSFGQSVTITATVTAAVGSATGGTVTFFDNGVQIGNPVALVNQQAAFTTTTLTVATHSITATYSGGSGFTGSTSSALNQVVNAGLAQTFTISGAPTTTAAGSQFSFTLTARDQSGNPATGYTGTVHFTSSDAQAVLPANYTFIAADNGVHTFTITLKTAGTQSFTATDTVTASITGTQSGITVNAAAAATFVVTGFPPSTTAGTAQSFTVTARDAFGNTATGYTGTNHFTSTDGQATLPANYTFVAADAGTHTFTATFKTAGTQSLTATDTTTASITGTQSGIAVTAAAASIFSVSGPPNTTAGTAQSFTVTARDAFDNAVTGYTGTVHFTSSDALATLPADYTFIAADSGVHTFTATLMTSGTQSFTATDTTTGSITGSANVTVSSAAATLTISGPSSTTAGIAQSFTVTAKDAFGNTATGYTGTVHFTSSDAQAVLPANYTFTASDNGTHTFTITLKTAGSQSLTATDTVTGSITGNASTTVNAAAASIFTVTGFPASTTAGIGQSFTLTARDGFGNIATGYTGTVHFTSTDGQAILPANYAFTAADNGAHTFNATLKTSGTQSVTATDTVTGSITGNASTTVAAAAASTFQVFGPSSTTAGIGQNFTVTAKDAFGNTATGYIGTVHFTSADAQATLPADYTFIAADNGVHTFTATLRTAGNQSLTATDTVTGSITGAATITVTAAAASVFQVSGPSSTTAGIGQNFTVTAKDAFGNTATGYIGTIHFISGDAQAVLPANYSFIAADNGVHTFTATMRTAGSQSLTATDTVTGSITGTTTITVAAAAASVFQVSGPSTTTAGTAQNFTVTARDAFGNTATGYTGTTHFVSNDALATLPADYTFTAADSGAHSFSITLRTVGNQSVIATDTTIGTITGTTIVTVNASPPPPPAPQPFAVGTAPGTIATVRMFNPDHTLRFAVQPFGATYRKGVRVAVGDVTGDGVPDIVAATNGGIWAKVRIIDGATGNVLSNNLLAGARYQGRVSVAVGDVNGDGIADIAVGTNQTRPRVRVFNGGNFTKLAGFTAGPTAGFKGNTSVALGDMTGDGKADLVVTSLYEGRSRVVGYLGSSLVPGGTPAAAFTKFTLGGKYASGLFLALGDVNGDDRADLVIGSAGTRSPSVVAFSGQSLVTSSTQLMIANFTPAGSSSKNGVRVGVRDINGDGDMDILTSSGEMVSAFQGGSGLPVTGLPTLMFAFDPDSAIGGGVWVG